jgi:hypothetical protein
MRSPAWLTVLTFSLLAGCAHVKPNPSPAVPAAPPAGSTLESPPPEAAAPPVASPPSAAVDVKPNAAAPSDATQPAAAPTPAASGRTGSKAQQKAPPPPAVAAAPPTAPKPKPPLDFNALVQRLRETSAIGVFTKLSIKNQVDDLLGAFRGYYGGKVPPTLDELHERYDGLVLKVVTLVQNGDAPLASAISASRGAIWERLSNRESFQAI